MHKTLLILLFFFGAALAASSQSLEQVLARLPQSLEWQALDLNFQSAQRTLESVQAATGLRLSVGADLSNTTLTSTGANTTTYKASASASLPILPWASQFDDLRKAERTFERAKLDLRDSRNTLVVNTSTQYLNLRLAQLDLELANSTLVLRQNQLKIALAQRNNNQITLDQLATSQQNLETAKINALQAESSLELAQLTLSNTLGQTELTVASSAAPLPTLSTTLEANLKLALEQRTDILKAVYTLRDAEDNLAIAQRDRWLPTTTLNLGVADSGASLTTGLNLQTGSLSFGGAYQPPSSTTPTGTTISLSASISIPVLAPSNDARISSSQTALGIAKQNLERSKKSAELDVRQKYLETQTALRRIDLSKKALELAKNTLSTTQARFTAGSLTKTDLETSQLAVQQAERDLENTVLAAYLAWLRLENAVGKGLIKV